jgi:hypothetical protein
VFFFSLGQIGARLLISHAFIEAADNPIPLGYAFRTRHICDVLLQLAWQADDEVVGLAQRDYFLLAKCDEPTCYVFGGHRPDAHLAPVFLAMFDKEFVGVPVPIQRLADIAC